MKKKFSFKFNDFGGSLTRLCKFVGNNLKLNTKYHICIEFLDCETICIEDGEGATHYSEYTFTDVASIDTFVS